MRFRGLLLKEFKETRLQGLIFAVVLLFFGSSSVLMQKYIAKFVPENLAEAFQPSLAAGLADFVGNSIQMGSIVAILITISAVAGERERGTLELLLVRPVGRIQIILSKFLIRVIYVMGGSFVAGLLAWYYAIYLFQPFPLGKIVLSSLAIGANVSFVVGLTMIFSSWVSSKITAAFWSGGVALALAILPTLKSPYDLISPFKYGGIARESLLGDLGLAGYVGDFSLVMAFTIFCVALACFIFKKTEKID